MKPWEETWRAYPESSLVVFDNDGCAEFDVNENQRAEDSMARAKLAAQAPAMARLLLKHQWSGKDDLEYPVCPECFRLPNEGHDGSCALAYVLFAAGALEQKKSPSTEADGR